MLGDGVRIVSKTQRQKGSATFLSENFQSRSARIEAMYLPGVSLNSFDL